MISTINSDPKPGPAPGLSLEELAANAQAGDHAQFQELAQRVREPLRRFLASRVSSVADADDLAQETLLRAYQKLDSYDPSRPFQTWLFTIGKRLAINYGQSSKRRQALADSVAETENLAASSSTSMVGDDLWGQARQALSEEQYRGLWLRYAQGCTIKEVASELSRTVVSTKVLLYRARKRLLSEVE